MMKKWTATEAAEVESIRQELYQLRRMLDWSEANATSRAGLRCIYRSMDRIDERMIALGIIKREGKQHES